ncbi:MAG: hypothetical protein HYS27_10500 [Deltaproteobacteria bacterium]|nr:hypothetical protein [Deltaproteobacteria bacterium]
MITVALALTLAAGPDPCAGVVDRTPACVAPDDVAATLAPDGGAKDAAAGAAGVIKAEQIPSKLALVAAALGIGGTAAISATYAVTPPDETADERQLRKVVRLGGVSVLAISGLVGGAALALAVFDPSTGAPRYRLIEDNE